MKLQDQVCTLEQANRLMSLGINQESYFVLGQRGVLTESWAIEGDEDVFYSAFTVAELGVMLPAGYDTMYCTNDGWRGFDLASRDMLDSKTFYTEAECRAAMLIYLLENKLITTKEVNTRLCAE